MAKKQFSTSDALALGTMATSLAGSFSKALRYEPDAGKPRLFNPVVRPSVGDPNLTRRLSEIDARDASTRRALRDFSGSDTNKGALGILQSNQQSEEIKSNVYAKHTDLIEAQEQRAADVLNDADKFNLGREYDFDTRKQSNDIQDARRIREAAKTSLQSGLKYFSGKDAFNRDSGAKEKQANTAIDLAIAKNLMDWEVGVSQSYIGREEEFSIAKVEREKLLKDTLLPHKSYNYHTDPNAIVPPTKRELRKERRIAKNTPEESSIKKFLSSPFMKKTQEVERAQLNISPDITREDIKGNYYNYSPEQRAEISRIIEERERKAGLDITAQ